MITIIEKLRKEAITKLFKMEGFSSVWPQWSNKIKEINSHLTERSLLDLGDYLRTIFYSTNDGRNQSSVSAGGAAWEALICWYLNICNIGRRTVIVKHHKDLIPTPVSNGITVNYGSFISNTESDLIAITFPDLVEYTDSYKSIAIRDSKDNLIMPKEDCSNYLELLNALTNRDFKMLEIHIIQCKTNWNDNAQIPMLWDMVYSSKAFNKDISIGKSGFNMNNTKSFSYSFVTVPTSHPENITEKSTCVARVRNLSGGNYWGMESKSGVASSVKEILNRKLSTGHTESHLTTIKESLPLLGKEEYSYFRYPL